MRQRGSIRGEFAALPLKTLNGDLILSCCCWLGLGAAEDEYSDCYDNDYDVWYDCSCS